MRCATFRASFRTRAKATATNSSSAASIRARTSSSTAFATTSSIFRDLYNTQSIEVLKGPSALIFGRGAGGGLLNRTLKEADWSTVREVTVQTGSWSDRRVAVDVGQGINQNVAARFNAFYEASDTFRDYGHLERYGINPTFSFRPSDDTKIKVSYEYFHDERLADRGNPSQGLRPRRAPSSTRFNPATPFRLELLDLLRKPELQRHLRQRADRHGLHRARLRQRPVGEEFVDLRRAICAAIATSIRETEHSRARSIRPTPRSISRPTRTRPTATISSTRPTSPTRP